MDATTRYRNRTVNELLAQTLPVSAVLGAAVVAFGKMTWPHRLARVMLAEQIYRAQQIIAGHPYHRE